MDKFKDAFYKIYVGEAKAALRLKVYARKAEEEGYTQIARLFRVIALSEEIHGSRALMKLEGIKSTEENLSASFDSETTVAAVAYNEFLKMAMAEGKNAEAKIFSQSRDVEETHAKLYKNAMDHMLEEREVTYHVCTVCGYVAEDQVPGTCPVCGVPSDKFEEFK